MRGFTRFEDGDGWDFFRRVSWGFGGIVRRVEVRGIRWMGRNITPKPRSIVSSTDT